MTPAFAIEADRAVRRFGPGRGVCGVTVRVPVGTCLSVLGRNGSGKSTLTRLLLGVEALDAGRIQVLGGPPPSGNPAQLARLGVALDRPAHWDGLTGWQNALLFLRAYGADQRAAAARLGDWFEKAGLAGQSHDPVLTYSFGMRRKLALVQALAHDPELLILDEPTAGLDAQFEAALAEEIRSRCRAGRSTWVAGNDPEWVSTLGGEVAVLEAGSVVASGTVAELVAAISPWRRAKIRLSRPLAGTPAAVPGVRAFTAEGTVAEALLDADPLALPALLTRLAERGGEVTGLEVRGATLRDVLLRKTGVAS